MSPGRRRSGKQRWENMQECCCLVFAISSSKNEPRKLSDGRTNYGKKKLGVHKAVCEPIQKGRDGEYVE